MLLPTILPEVHAQCPVYYYYYYYYYIMPFVFWLKYEGEIYESLRSAKATNILLCASCMHNTAKAWITNTVRTLYRTNDIMKNELKKKRQRSTETICNKLTRI